MANSLSHLGDLFELSGKKGLGARQRGVALVLVLWFVAALSIVAVSLSAVSRVDGRAVAILIAETRAVAAADAAIQLVLRDIDADPTLVGGGGLLEAQVSFNGYDVTVSVRPETAFVNLNQASHALLRDLIHRIGGEDESTADLLATAVAAWREPSVTGNLARDYEAAGVGFRPRHGMFVAPEDLLQVLGFEYPLYVKIRDFVTVHGGSPGVDDRFAPEEILILLARGNRDVAKRIAEARSAGEFGVDTTMLDQSLIERGTGHVLKLDAHVVVDSVGFRHSRWLERAGGRNPQEPWVTLALETRPL